MPGASAIKAKRRGEKGLPIRHTAVASQTWVASAAAGVIFGVIERSLASKPAIVISALVFSLAHLPNDGVSVLAIAVIAAYGVMQAALYMKTGRLWACIGTHIAWNYCVSQVFSSTVSGHAATGGLLRGELAGNPMLTGGVFGVEGSLIALLLIAAAAAFWLRRAFASQA